MNTLLMAVLLAVPNGNVGDTVVTLQRGDMVRFENLAGEMTIEGWDRDELEVEIDRDEAGVSVRREGSRVVVTREGRRGRQREAEFVVRVPRWAAIEVAGQSLEITVRGTGNALVIANMRGDIRVEDATGDVTISTMQGEVDVIDVTGRVVASSQSDDVTLVRVRGQITVHATDGHLTLEDIESSSVEAETQDGDIDFEGSILPGGEYGFFVHDGDATIAIPESSSARVSASTFDGEFESEFPVRVERYIGGREFEFLIGDGSARIRVQVFDGKIQLLRRR
jgi:putative adhesin